MDWESPGDLKRRFQLFKQKCELIFEGPLSQKPEEYKSRMLLLWVDDKGLEIYNAADWGQPVVAANPNNAENPANNLQLARIWTVLEAYVKPRSNQVLASYQLRCLKQEDLSFDEYLTKAKLLLAECHYHRDAVDRILRDTLVFGIKSDKIRRDAIDEGDTLTLQKLIQIAKTHESTETQMAAMKSEQTSSTHAVRSKPKKNKPGKPKQPSNSQPQKPDRQKTTNKSCGNCDGQHAKSDPCPAKTAVCNFCKKKGHYAKVCRKKAAHEASNSIDTYTLNDIGSITTQEVGNVCSVSTPTDTNKINKIFANVKLNDSCHVRMKVDTGSDTCLITQADLKKTKLKIEVNKSNCILKNYGGGTIPHIGTARLKLSYRGKSTIADFKIVQVSDSPSVLGCSQSLQLGILTLNVNSLSTAHAAVSLTREKVLSDYSDCFDKIGKFPGAKYSIKLIEDAQPVVHPPRTVPVHIMPLYKAELDKMLAENIISPVTEPTDWVNSIVCNVRDLANGEKKVRLCLDPRDLNKNIRREHYYSRTIDEILPQLHNKQYFSVVDTKKGYWHVELDEPSSLLCTFNTPFGRYKFNRLPFGVRVSQDVFQKKLDHAYEGIPNVTGIADDIIVAGATQEEHDTALTAMLEASRRNNIGLNSDKFQFKSSSVNFFGHTITNKGLEPASEKVEAIRNLKKPNNCKELLTALGMITYLNRFSAKLADLTAPLRELTKKDVHFHWEDRHDKAFELIKEELTTAKILSFYDSNPATTTILQCDASQIGLGAWLRQIDQQGREKIVAMSSRSLTDTESRYSNIERECLAVQNGLEKFEYYLMGRHTLVETDHSPLEQIFKKNVADAPARLQRMILGCLKFDIDVRYKPGIKVPVADALSRVCIPPKPIDQPEEHEISFISGVKTPIDMQRIKEESAKDSQQNLLKDTIFRGWPAARKNIPFEIQEYWNIRCDLVLDDGVILKGNRILIPVALRDEVLKAIHTAHQGEVKSLLLARESVFWPGITNDIKQMVKQCPQCAEHQSAPPKMPIQQPDLPNRPWEKIGSDLFEYKGKHYLMIVDYYSRYIIVKYLPDIRSETVSNAFIEVLTEFGLPSTIMADRGTQYTSELFKQKCKDSGIDLIFSSPYHHQSNSIAERSIGIVKSLWKKEGEDGKSKSTALWMHRITPIDSKTPSPYEMLFGRKPRSLLPCSNKAIASQHPETEQHKEANQARQQKQAEQYNRKASRDLRPLQPGEPVDVFNTINRTWQPATVVRRERDRSYVIRRDSREYFRTREHIRPRQHSIMNDVTPPVQHVPIIPRAQQPAPIPDDPPTSDVQPPARPTASDVEPTSVPTVAPKQTGTTRPTVTRAGRVVKKPDRYSP